MKTIGLIGGMSWESTIYYYQVINEMVKKKLGGLHSAKCLINSVDFHEVEECQSSGNWSKSAEILGNAASCLEKSGADFILICTNTMHKVFDEIATHVTIPLVHIADVTADELIRNGVKKTALLGTKYTMEQDFYKAKLITRGIDVMIPSDGERQYINDVIFNELCLGNVSNRSKNNFLKIIEQLKSAGAESVILGCTEIGMLVNQNDTYVKLFDTTQIHAEKAVELALK